jgi:single-strand DNA-binding protein
MLNETQVTILGWVGGDVTVREVSGGRQVATFRVASTPRHRRDGVWVSGSTTWHTVTAWNRLAAHVARSVRSGDPVVVHGTFTSDSWTTADGVNRSSFVVVARSVGHDLSHGTTTFERAPAAQETADAA